MKTCPACLNDNSDGTATCSTCGYSFDKSVTGGDKTRIVENKITGISTGDMIANRYIVQKELGRGGMGVVYLARDSELRDTEVALKVIYPSLVSHDETLDRFIEEVITSQRLTHQNIVKVYDLKRWQDLRFFTMEYVEGRSLKKWITERNNRQKPPFNLQETVSIIGPLLEALTYAHKHTIHRDIKPENIMVRGDFPDVSIKVLDFGIAKTLSTSRFTQTSQSLGTAYYMSPEQMTDARGIDHRADLYSVGMILYEMLTGKLAVGIPVLPSKQFSDLPPAVDDMIVHLLSVSPGDRYPDAESTRKALSKVFEAYQIHQEAKKKEAEDEIAGMLEKSRMYIEKHQWAEAIGSLIRAKKLVPENKQIKEQLAIAGDNLKKKEKEDEIAKMLERGRILVEHRRWIDGERALKRVLYKDPDNTEVKKWLFKAVQGKKALARLINEVKEAERSGELSAAIQLLKRSKPLSSDPEQVEQRISRLQKLIERRKPDNNIEPDREHAEIIKPENQEVAKKQVPAIETSPDSEIHKAKRKWNFTLIGGLAVIIIIGAVYLIQNMRSDYISDNRTVKEPVKKTTRLYVETEPSGAKVRILNITPKYQNGMELETGDYHIEVSADGYETRKEWVAVYANKDKHLTITLPKVKIIETAQKIQGSLETVVFFDDFNDGVIDPELWRSNGKTGGSVSEHDGLMDVQVYNGNDIQYLTIPNLLVDADILTLEVKVQVRKVAPDKNAGFWIGDKDGNIGFNCVFSEKWQRFNTSIGSVGKQYGTDPVSVGGGDNADWHVVKIVKEGTKYTITIDNRLVGTSEKIQPKNLHFNGGRPWMSNYGYEAAELHFDYVKVTAVKGRPDNMELVYTKPISPIPVNGICTITGLRYWSSSHYTRIVIDANKETKFTHRLLKKGPSINKPGRIYIDLLNSRLDKNTPKTIPINNKLLIDARVGQYTSNSVRVVMDLQSFGTYKIFTLKDPFRIIIDVWEWGS